MSTSNSGFLKFIVLLLLGFAVWSVYRIETLSGKIETLSGNSGIADMTDSTLSEDCSDVKPSEQAADIRRLQSKVESLERELAVLSGKMDKLEKNRREDSGSIVSRLFGGNDDNGAAVGKRHSGVAAKVRVDNHYVEGDTYLPDNTGGYDGVVVINVSVDAIGIVTEASVGRSSTISDEDLLYECREAALKTRFSYNPSSSYEGTRGTITYTFTTE